MKKTIVSWSGGKDSCFALQKSVEKDFQPVVLVTALDANGNYSKSNGVSLDILKAQAEKLRVHLYCFNTNWENYEENLINALIACKNTYHANYCVFGDIDIVAHHDFEELVCCKAGISAYLPLWGMSRERASREEIKTGIRAKLSLIRKDKLAEALIGRDYDEELLKMLSAIENVDLCGENGEFHTIVYNSAMFYEPINLELSKTIHLDEVYLSAIFKICDVKGKLI